jgi:hypothetical protein
MLENIYIIADTLSDRYQDLQSELACLARFVSSPDKIRYRYPYHTKNISDDHYYSFWTWPDERISVTGWNEGNIMINKKQFSLCLNHLSCLSRISNNNDNNWSLICEDDIYIPNKDSFDTEFAVMINEIPHDADIVWVSTGKKPLDCTYRDVCGYDSPTPLECVNTRFFHIQKSRYTDCILLKRDTAKFLQDKLVEHKIGLPIDWEFNYLLSKYPQIKSYWLMPALIQQNPKYI